MYLVIGVATDNQFKKLSEILKLEDKEQNYITNNLRCINRDALFEEIQTKMD